MKKKKAKKTTKKQSADINDETAETMVDVAEEVQENESAEIDEEPEVENEPVKESKKSSNSDSNFNPPDDIPPDEFDPLAEPVVQRDYTKFGLEFEDTEPVSNEKIEEPSYTQPPSMGAQDVEFEDLSQDSSDDFNSGAGVNENYDDLSPQQKRRAAEKTADAILTAYSKFVPIPFKKLSSFNIAKLEQLEIEDELRMSMIVQEGNITIRDYVMQHNEQVEEVFTVTDEMLAELKPPLQDVLMEQQLVLTPLQRLGLAVGGNLLTFTFAAVQLNNQTKDALRTFKSFHAESRNQPDATAYEAPPSENNSSESNQQRHNETQTAPQPPPTMDDYLTADDKSISVENEPNEN